MITISTILFKKDNEFLIECPKESGQMKIKMEILLEIVVMNAKFTVDVFKVRMNPIHSID